MERKLIGIASLIESVDKKMMVFLRDNRTLFGILRSVDFHASLVLHQTTEKIFAGNKYAEIDLGTIVIRGENIVICGEIDLDHEKNFNHLEKVSIEEIVAIDGHQPTDKFIVQKERDKIKEGITFRDFYEPNHI